METSAAEPPGRRGFCSPVRAGGEAPTLLPLKTRGSLRESKKKGPRGTPKEPENVRSPQRMKTKGEQGKCPEGPEEGAQGGEAAEREDALHGLQRQDDSQQVCCAWGGRSPSTRVSDRGLEGLLDSGLKREERGSPSSQTRKVAGSREHGADLIFGGDLNKCE